MQLMTALAVVVASLSTAGTAGTCADAASNFSGNFLEVSQSCQEASQPAPERQGAGSAAAPIVDPFKESRQSVCRLFSAAGRECVEVIDNRLAAFEDLDPADPITIDDLAAFRPIVGELVVEPDGWGVVGTPTNFYATAESHTMQGELLGSQVTVRWTPTTYAFDYGDGASQTTEGSGAAWRGTGEQWTETSTSHAYASRDDVTASLTVTFTAEVDAGGGWFQVPGSLPVTAPAVPVKVFEVDTVLTAGDCTAAPTAPGCG